MLEVAFEDSCEGVYMKTRKGADLFDVAHVKSKSNTATELVKDLLFAGDSTLVVLHSHAIQTDLPMLQNIVIFKINIKKTEYVSFSLQILKMQVYR